VLSAGLSSRRGRDAIIIVISVLALGFQLIRFIHFSSIDPRVVDQVDGVLRWLPPGMLAQSVIDARAGRFALAVVEMVPAAVLLPLLLGVWARALDHASTVMGSGETPRIRSSGQPRSLPLLLPWLPFLERHPWGAVTAKELRYVGREPRRKVNLVNSLLVGVGVPIWIAVRSHGEIGSRVVLLATLAGYVAVLGSSNQFGLDGPALWLDVIAGDTIRDVLIGKNVATVLVVLPIVSVVGAGLAAATGGWLYLPAAIVLALAGLAAGLGTANVISVHFPIRLPESRSPFAGAGGGQGCATGAILMGCVLLQNLLLAPVAIIATVTAVLGPVWLVVAVPVCAAYGATLWWVGLGMATRWGRGHLPELLVRVNPARTD
jgi:ABC-2 type transport system permease protein